MFPSSQVLLRLGNLPAAVEAARSQLEWQPRDESPCPGLWVVR